MANPTFSGKDLLSSLLPPTSILAFPLLSGRVPCLPTLLVTFLLAFTRLTPQSPSCSLTFVHSLLFLFEEAEEPHPLPRLGTLTEGSRTALPSWHCLFPPRGLWVCFDMSLSCYTCRNISNYTVDSFSGTQIGSEGLKCCLEALSNWGQR